MYVEYWNAPSVTEAIITQNDDIDIFVFVSSISVVKESSFLILLVLYKSVELGHIIHLQFGRKGKTRDENGSCLFCFVFPFPKMVFLAQLRSRPYLFSRWSLLDEKNGSCLCLFLFCKKYCTMIQGHWSVSFFFHIGCWMGHESCSCIFSATLPLCAFFHWSHMC